MFDFAEKRPSQTPIVVLDTETTGLQPWLGHRVVEIGALRLENGEAVRSFNQLLNPERPMDPGASAVNGIYDSDLANQPTFSDVAPALLNFVEGALIVAHNAAFDAGFVGAELALAGLNPLPNPWVCTLQLARRLFHFDGNSLTRIAHQLGVRQGRAHRALNDVYTTAEIFRRMVQSLTARRIETVGDLLWAQGGAIHTPAPHSTSLPPLLAAAVAARQRIRITYGAPANQSRREITPLYATSNKDRIYLVATCHLRNEQRTFRLDRILAVEPISTR